MQEVTSLEQLRRPEQKRPLYTFSVPDSIARDTGVKSIGMVELTVEEELMATRRAGQDQAKVAVELVKESLRALNGKPLSLSDGSADREWTTLHPKVRTLAATAWSNLHNIEKKEADDFLASRMVDVG